MRRGRLPDDVREQVLLEGVDLLEEGVRGSVTVRHWRAPGERANWRKQAVRGAIAITRQRLLVYVGGKPVVRVRYDDARFATLELAVVKRRLSILVADASIFDPRLQGSQEVRLAISDPEAALQAVRLRSRLT